jgi:hypothetical protein
MTWYSRSIYLVAWVLFTSCGDASEASRNAPGQSGSGQVEGSSPGPPTQPSVSQVASHRAHEEFVSKSPVRRKDAEELLEVLKRAIKTGDRVAMADAIRFPLALDSLDGRFRPSISREEFMRRYPDIVTKCVRETIEDASMASLVGSDAGLSFAHGRIWLLLESGKPKVGTINKGFLVSCPVEERGCCPKDDEP